MKKSVPQVSDQQQRHRKITESVNELVTSNKLMACLTIFIYPDENTKDSQNLDSIGVAMVAENHRFIQMFEFLEDNLRKQMPEAYNQLMVRRIAKAFR